MQLTFRSFQTYFLISIPRPYIGCWAREMRRSNKYLVKKLRFPFIFVENSQAKNFRPSKKLAPFRCHIAIAAKRKGTRSYNCAIGHGASKLRNAVDYGLCQICFEESQKTPPFFESRPKKHYWQKSSQQAAAQLDSVLSLSAETLEFPSIL